MKKLFFCEITIMQSLRKTNQHTSISRLGFRLLPTKEVARPLLPIRPVLCGRGPASPKPINHTTMAVLAVNELVAFVAHGTKGCTAVTIFSDKMWGFCGYTIWKKTTTMGFLVTLYHQRFFLGWNHDLSLHFPCLLPTGKLSHPSTPPANAMHIGLT